MQPIEGTIAIVGRPNVGKSTLFNRLLGSRQAITVDIPGTTRDRIYGTLECENHLYTVIDTGGLELIEKNDRIFKLIRIQVELAVDEADLIFLVVDGNDGLNPLDEHVSNFLRKTGKEVRLFVNKIDDFSNRDRVHDFYRLGFNDPIWLSSLHGLNLDKLLSEVIEFFKKPPGQLVDEDPDPPLRLSIVGQPNVGKSTLLNRFLKTDRVLVDNVPGTTRDPIESPFKIGDQRFILTDTAGIRRVNQLKDHIDKIAVIYSEKVIDQSDLVLFLLDVTRSLSQQDKRIAGTILEERKPCILVVNKWDTVEDKEEKIAKLEEQFEEELYFFNFCPRIYLSAETGLKVQKLQDAILDLSQKMSFRVNTRQLNQLVQEASIVHQPPLYKGKQLKIYYVTQLHKGGTFLFKVNNSNLVHFSYYRYLENTLRNHYKLEGIPIRLIFKGKEKKEG
jgi:GTPase